MKLKPRVSAVAVASGVLLVAWPASAADEKITYYEHVRHPAGQLDVLPSPAGKNIGSLVAPMSLTTYEEARPWARAIARKVKAREMPPWFAESPKGVFSNERGLTDKEIATWSRGSTPGPPEVTRPRRQRLCRV